MAVLTHRWLGLDSSPVQYVRLHGYPSYPSDSYDYYYDYYYYETTITISTTKSITIGLLLLLLIITKAKHCDLPW
jgi:hypothetical protein